MNNGQRSHIASIAWGFAGLSSVAAPVTAQEVPLAAAAGTADSAPRAGVVLEEIMVTATKREVSLQDVPLAISTIEAARLEANGVVSTADLPRISPGISFTPSGEAKLNSFSIRGVGTYALSAALEPAVGVAVDGVPLARIGGSISDLVDIQRIEVLKGPQGTLFGKNATAGVISIVTHRPELGRTGLNGQVSYGSDNELNADAALNVALGQTAAARFTAWRFGHDGVTPGPDGREYNNKNSFGGRLGLGWEPTDELRINLTAEYAERDERGPGWTIRKFSNTAPFGPLVAAYESGRGIVPSATNQVASFRATPDSEGDSYYGTGLIEYTFGDGYVLSSVTSYRKVESRGQMDPFVTATPDFGIEDLTDDEQYDQFTQEVRVASPGGGTFEYVAGLFYYDFSIEDVQLQTFVGLPVPGVSRYSRRNTVTNALENYAAFGEGTLRLTDRFRLLAGVRFSRDHVEGTFDRAQGVGADSLPIPSTVPLFTFKAQEREFEFVSWRAGAQVDVGADAMAYVTASRGYKAPGFNLTQSLTPATLIDGARVNAETVLSYEAGFKSQFFDRRLTVNIAAFLTQFEDFQTTVGVSVDGPPTFVIQNANEIKSSGAELEINARPADAVTLGLSGAYVDARYTDFDNAACYTGEPTLPAGSPLTPGYCVGGVQTLDDWQLANAPKWSASAFSRYDDEVLAGWRFFGQLDANYRSSVVYEASRNPDERQGGRTLVNGHFGIGPVDRAWDISLYVRNIGDKYYVDRIRANPWNLTQIPSYFARRQVGVMFKFNF